MNRVKCTLKGKCVSLCIANHTLMHRASLLLSALGSFLLGSAQNVTIVESQSFPADHTMDTLWSWVAASMGYSPTIVAQDALNDPASLSGTDVLIISSGVIDHGANHYATVSDLVLSGRPVFIQSEFLSTYCGNIMFDEVMTAVGAEFAWSVSDINENLGPVAISGDLSTTPNNVPAVDYFWFGCTGGGAGVEGFLSIAGEELGWVYRDPFGTYGTVITTTDQDWVIHNVSPELMENILAMLVSDIHTGVRDPGSNPEISVYPDPFLDRLSFTVPADGMCDLTITDMSGRAVLKRSFMRSLELDTEGFRAGTYLYQIRQGIGPVTMGKLLKL